MWPVLLLQCNSKGEVCWTWMGLFMGSGPFLSGRCVGFVLEEKQDEILLRVSEIPQYSPCSS